MIIVESIVKIIGFLFPIVFVSGIVVALLFFIDWLNSKLS